MRLAITATDITFTHTTATISAVTATRLVLSSTFSSFAFVSLAICFFFIYRKRMFFSFLMMNRTADALPALLERGWKIQDRYRLPYWDALIVAAAKAASCRYLLTEDLQAGQELDGVEVVNPFLQDPESIL